MDYDINIGKYYNTPTRANIYFGTTSSGVIQVCSFGDMYIDATTKSGVNVIHLRNVDKTKLFIHNTTESSITSSWVNDKYLFVGTTYTGIEYICLTELNNDGINLDYTYSTYNFASYPDITSNHVNYIHCSDDYVMCCTESGIDCYTTTASGYHYYTTVSGAKKCFVTDDSAYYTLTSGTYEAIIVIKDFDTSWDTPYRTFDNDPYDGLFPTETAINDIYIKTTTSGANIILAATTSGIYAIDEDTGFYDLYLTENA